MASPHLWVINELSSRIEEEIENVEQVICININKARCLKKGARTFRDFASGNVGENTEILFQLFIKTCQGLKDKLNAISADDRFPGGEPPMQFLLEAVRDAEGKEITDYTFWCLITNRSGELRKLDANVAFAEILRRDFHGHEKQDRNSSARARGSYVDPREEMKPYHKWKQVKDVDALTHIFDMNLGYQMATIASDAIFVSGPAHSNGLCATKTFNPLAALAGRGCREDGQIGVRQCQRLSSFNDYITGGAASLDQPFTFCLPEPRDTLRIPIASMTDENITRKYLPEYQQRDALTTLQKLPIIVRDFERTYNQGNSIGFTRDLLRSDMDAFKSRLSKRRQQYRKANAGAAAASPDDVSLFSSDDDDDGIGVVDDDDNLEEDAVDQFRRHLAELALFCGLDTLVADRADGIPFAPYDANNLSRAAGHMEVRAEGFVLDGSVRTATTAYAEIRDVALANIKAIHELEQRISGSSNVRNWRVVARKLYLLNQDMVFGEYPRTCRSQDSTNLSCYEKANLAAIEKEGLYEPDSAGIAKCSLEMTPFGVWEIREYMENEQLWFAAKTHRILSLWTKYRLDSWRMSFGMHLNSYICSLMGGNGKSWLVDQIKVRSNEGTMEEESYRSDKSEANSDTNRNGGIVAWHEMDKTLFIPSKNADNNRAGMMKERMTSNCVTPKRLVILASGQKVTEVSTSECIAVFLGACNWDIMGEMEGAAATRAHVIPFEETGKQRSLLGLGLHENMLDGQEKTLKSESIRKHKKIQAMVMEIERLIYCGGLKDVSLHTALLVLLHVENSFVKNGLDVPSFRTFQRTILLARMNCILSAIETTFFCKGAKYHGKGVKVEWFKDLDAKLYVQAEHVIAAIGEQIDMYVDPFESIVRRGIHEWYMAKNSAMRRECMKTISIPQDGKVTHTKDPNYISFQRHVRGNTPQRVYLRDIAADIKIYTDKLKGEDYKPSIERIVEVLARWSGKTTRCKAFSLNSDDWVTITKDEKSEMKDRHMIQRSNDRVFILYEVIHNQEAHDVRNIVLDGIKDVMNRVGQMPRTMPFDNDLSNPFIRNMITTGESATGAMAPLIFESPSFMNDFTKKVMAEVSELMDGTRSFRYHVILEDVDAWGLAQRNESIYIDGSPINPNFREIQVFRNHSASAADMGVSESGCYFLGQPIEAYMQFDSFKPKIDEIWSIYGILDLKDEDYVCDDADFDPDDYCFDDGCQTHWDYLGMTREQYKYRRHHPLLANQLLNFQIYADGSIDDFDIHALGKSIAEKSAEREAALMKQLGEKLALGEINVSDYPDVKFHVPSGGVGGQWQSKISSTKFNGPQRIVSRTDSTLERLNVIGTSAGNKRKASVGAMRPGGTKKHVPALVSATSQLDVVLPPPPPPEVDCDDAGSSGIILIEDDDPLGHGTDDDDDDDDDDEGRYAQLDLRDYSAPMAF